MPPSTAISAPGMCRLTRRAPTHNGQHRNGDGQSVGVRLTELLEVGEQLLCRPAAAARNPEHARDLADGDLNAHAGQKADQDGPRQEIGEKAQANQARDEEKGAGQQRQHLGVGHVLWRPCSGEAGRSGGHDGRRGRVGSHDQVAGGAEEGEEGHGDQEGVEAGNERRAGDFGIAHDLGDGQRGQGEPAMMSAGSCARTNGMNPTRMGRRDRRHFAAT